ncbi:hypothetical protein ACWEH3_32240 [Nocardia sp. NPDC004718]
MQDAVDGRFGAASTDRVRELAVGDGAAPGTEVGSMINVGSVGAVSVLCRSDPPRQRHRLRRGRLLLHHGLSL